MAITLLIFVEQQKETIDALFRHTKTTTQATGPGWRYKHNKEGARAPATGRGWPGPAGTVKINGKVLMAGAQL